MHHTTDGDTKAGLLVMSKKVSGLKRRQLKLFFQISEEQFDIAIIPQATPGNINLVLVLYLGWNSI
jgi:hypothetical protein